MLGCDGRVSGQPKSVGAIANASISLQPELSLAWSAPILPCASCAASHLDDLTVLAWEMAFSGSVGSVLTARRE